MEVLSARLSRVHCVDLDEYPKWKYWSRSGWNKPVEILTTPDISNSLSRIGKAARIIEAANQISELSPRKQISEAGLAGLHGQRVLEELQCYLGLEALQDQSSEEVLKRLHQAEQQVLNYESELWPINQAAQKQIRTECDRLNVTDRLLGYRNNLNRSGISKYTQVGYLSVDTRI
ncbi:hypothetical protein PHET_03313 [Paragonimus heterotremus]|uniref:Uncharacterized protein n=1 Tax=Paragonimus heterotremus TaxID=100268 RepID=A0A8J4SQU7_9TREM|nr:hypothetical protein PHET_03313 [Paragonimus heterotremus]